MFKTARVPAFLNGFSGHGDDVDAKELKFVFYINSISQELAREISLAIADRLFRQNTEGEWEPSAETTKQTFGGITIPMQNITFHELPEIDDREGVRVEGCAISNLRASRKAIEATFEFDVVVPMDRQTMKLVEKYYKATCFLTMEEIQRRLEVVDNLSAEVSAALQNAADETDGKSAGAGEGRRKRKKKDTEEVPA